MTEAIVVLGSIGLGIGLMWAFMGLIFAVLGME